MIRENANYGLTVNWETFEEIEALLTDDGHKDFKPEDWDILYHKARPALIELEAGIEKEADYDYYRKVVRDAMIALKMQEPYHRLYDDWVDARPEVWVY